MRQDGPLSLPVAAGHAPGVTSATLVEILDGLEDGCYGVDRAWTIIAFNRAAETHFGVDRSAVLGRDLWHAFPAATGTEFERRARTVMATGVPVEFEGPTARKSDCWLQVRISATSNGLTVSFRDVTARRMAEMARQESERRFRTMADNAPALIWMTNTEGHPIFLNRRHEEVFGRHVEELQRIRWRDLIHPDDLPSFRKVYFEARHRSEGFRTETRIADAENRILWLRVDGVPRFGPDGTLEGYTGCSVDITDIKRAEEALRNLNRTLEERVEARTRELSVMAEELRESEARYRAIFDHSPDAIFVIAVTPGRRLVFEGGNPATAALFDLDEAAMRGHELQTVLPRATVRRHRRHILRCLAEKRPVQFEFTLDRPAGRAVCDAIVVPLMDEAGKVVRLAVTSRDVTAQRHGESALRQAQKMEAVGQLTGGMAHDFNNLLQALTSCLQMIGRRNPAPELVPVVEAGQRAIQRGARLVQQLMAFARRQALRPEPVDVRDRVLAMSDLMSHALRADIDLSLSLEPGLWPVMADPTQFELALLNLAVNARDAMPTGGCLRIEGRNLLLGAGEDPDGLAGAFVRLSVSDNGPGMDADTLARAFDPFFTTKAVGKGSGLGLAQVQGFARQSGGVARIDSAPGQGTTVTLLLPRTDKVPAGVRQVDSRPSTAGTAHRILLVEDDPIVGALVCAALTDWGHEITRATTADQAMTLITSGEAFDLVLTDVVMPGAASGLDLARTVRQLRPGLPVVLATGYSEGIVAGEGFRVLAKPFRMETLINAIEDALAASPALRRVAPV